MIAALVRFGLGVFLLAGIAALVPASHGSSLPPRHRTNRGSIRASTPSPSTMPSYAAEKATFHSVRPTVPPPDTVSVNVDLGGGFFGTIFEVLAELIIIGLLIGLLLVVFGTFTVGFAAVSIFIETGCLRFLVLGMGWIAAFLGSIFLGDLVGQLLGMEDFLTRAGMYLGGLGYPLGWAWGRKRARQMPRDEFLTWKRTLTSGALLGTGAGSAMSLLKSAIFKGGGGSFGGGGASGSFQGGGSFGGSGAQGAAGGVATGQTVALRGAGGSQQAAEGQNQALSSSTPGSSSSGSSSAASQPDTQHAPSWGHRQAEKVRHRMQQLRWYHGCAFILVVLIFIPVGLGLGAGLQNRTVLIVVLALGTVAGALRLWRRWASSSPASDSKTSSFQGGSTSNSLR